MWLTPPHFDPAQSGVTAFNLRAVPLFERMRWRGRIHRLLARLTRRSWHLLLLDDYVSADRIRSPHETLIQPVDLRRIVGSVNRCDDFDRSFYPLNDRLATRWVRVVSMMLQDTALPPVELIRVGEVYFVVDGHHRISAARALRHTSIDALLAAAYD